MLAQNDRIHAKRSNVPFLNEKLGEKCCAFWWETRWEMLCILFICVPFLSVNELFRLRCVVHLQFDSLSVMVLLLKVKGLKPTTDGLNSLHHTSQVSNVLYQPLHQLCEDHWCGTFLHNLSQHIQVWYRTCVSESKKPNTRFRQSVHQLKINHRTYACCINL